MKNDIQILPYDSGAVSFNQYCVFKLFDGYENWTVMLVYRPPSTTQENTEQLARIIMESPPNTIIMGDFNLPGIDWQLLTSDSKGRPILEACAEKGLEQLEYFATHVKGNTLDLVLTDVPDKIRSVVSAGRLGRSDHEILIIEVDTRRPETQGQGKSWNWKQANWEAMRRKLSTVQWQEDFDGLTGDEAWTHLKGRLDAMVEEHVPERTRAGTKRPPWLSVDLLRLIRLKRRLWTKYKRSPTAENLEEYKKMEKTTGKQIKYVKKQVERRVAESKDKKIFYSYLKTKTKSRAGVGPICVEGQILTENVEIAEALNDYFGSVFREEEDGPPPSATPIPGRKRCSRVWFRPSQVKEKNPETQDKISSRSRRDYS